MTQQGDATLLKASQYDVSYYRAYALLIFDEKKRRKLKISRLLVCIPFKKVWFLRGHLYIRCRNCRLTYPRNQRTSEGSICVSSDDLLHNIPSIDRLSPSIDRLFIWSISEQQPNGCFGSSSPWSEGMSFRHWLNDDLKDYFNQSYDSYIRLRGVRRNHFTCRSDIWFLSNFAWLLATAERYLFCVPIDVLCNSLW